MRIYLSPPDVGPEERAFLVDAFDSNWIAPVGPHVDAFEEELAAAVGAAHAVALSSGTAGLHLALLVLGVGPGDDVLVPTLTFVSAANAALYVGAKPVFVDSDRATWNIDPNLVADELARRGRSGRLPAAVVAVDLYGQCADFEALRTACQQYGVPLIEDAAEALGASYQGHGAGTLGDIGVFSFNGNKIITTSGGGMLVTDNEHWADRARYLSTQARQPVLHYEHTDVGFNYRMSNLLAALGRGQLKTLTAKVRRRRGINARYKRRLAGLPGVRFMPDAPDGEPTSWLTVITVEPEHFGADRDEVIRRLAHEDIEARPTWKPMHRQPLFDMAPLIGGAVADAIFDNGVCLPSGSSLRDEEVDEVAALISECASMERPA